MGKHLNRCFHRAAAVIGALAMAAACSAARAEDAPKMGGTLSMPGNWGVPAANLSWLEPAYSVENLVVSALIHGSLFQSPTEIGGPVIPDLATGYEYNADNTAVTIKLRPNVKFSDGTPLNAEAILWLWSPEFDANPSSKAAIYLKNVKSVTAVDDLTVKVEFKSRDTTFIAALASQPVGLVASPTAFKKLGRNGFDQKPVGAGPYILQTHIPNQSIVLRKNPDYWDAEHVYLDAIRQVLTGTDSAAIYQNLLSGQIELMNRVQIATFAPEIIAQAMGNKDLAHTKVPGASYAFIAFTRSPPFDDKRAREALYHCVDREALAEKTLQGFAEPTYIFGGPYDGMDFYPKDPATGKPSIAAGKALNPYDYDPEKARAIVKELGGLKFKMTTSMGKNFATAVQQIFAQCDIDAEVYTPPPAQYTSILQQGTYQAYLNNTAGVSDMRLFSKYITPDQPLDQQNQVNDPVVTAAFNKSIGDTGKDLEDDFTTIFKQLASDAVLLPVVAAKVYDIHSPCLKGLTYFGNATSLLHAWKSCD